MTKAIANVLLMIAGIAAACGALEITVRTVSPQVLGPSIFEPGPDGLFILKADFDARLRSPEYDIHVRLNSQRMRDVERTYAKPSGVFRILVVGDSFTMGAGVGLDETYVKGAQQALNSGRTSASYDVMNAGVQNWGTGEQLIVLEREWLRYDPDLVVWAFQNTDVTDNIQHAYWTIADGKLVRLPGGERDRSMASAVSHIPGYKWAIQHSHAALYLRHTLVRVLQRGPSRAPVTKPDDRSPDDEYPWRLTERLLAEMHRVLAARRTPVMIAYIPNREEVAAYRQNDRPNVTERFLEGFTSRQSIPFMSFVPVLADAGASGDLYYQRDGHWTAKAHRIAAAHLVEFLRSRALIGNASQSFSRASGSGR